AGVAAPVDLDRRGDRPVLERSHHRGVCPRHLGGDAGAHLMGLGLDGRADRGLPCPEWRWTARVHGGRGIRRGEPGVPAETSRREGDRAMAESVYTVIELLGR